MQEQQDSDLPPAEFRSPNLVEKIRALEEKKRREEERIRLEEEERKRVEEENERRRVVEMRKREIEEKERQRSCNLPHLSDVYILFLFRTCSRSPVPPPLSLSII